MNINNNNNLPIDPYISHMRIAWEESMRKQTEKYWRDKIASQINILFPGTDIALINSIKNYRRV